MFMVNNLIGFGGRQATADVFDPASLFGASEDGGYWDANILTSLYEERTGASATTQSSVDGVVGTVLDQSGNANHMTAGSDAARPILRQSGSLYYLEYDGTDDFLDTSISGLGGGNAAFCTAFNPQSDTSWVLHQGTSTGAFLLAGIDGNTSTTLHVGFGSPTLRMDGASWTPSNRDEVHDDLTGAAHVITIESATTTVTRFGIFYASGANYLAGRWSATVAIDRALTSGERSDLEGYMDGIKI